MFCQVKFYHWLKSCCNFSISGCGCITCVTTDFKHQVKLLITGHGHKSMHLTCLTLPLLILAYTLRICTTLIDTYNILYLPIAIDNQKWLTACIIVINPRRMCKGYGSHSPYSVCVCVCYQASRYIPHLYAESLVPLGFLCCSQRMYCVDFVENALFKSYDEICWWPLPSSLLDELSMDKRDNDGFFSRRLVYRTNNESYNLTDSSLVTINYQQCFLAFHLYCVLLIRYVQGHATYYVIACNCTCAFLWLLDTLDV